MLVCNNLNKSYGVNDVLSNISFKIMENDRIGIVGKNGAGKTTLFKIITENLEYDSGDFFIQKKCTIGYLSQYLDLDTNNSMYKELEGVFKPLLDLEEEIKVLQDSMGNTNNLDSIMDRYSQLTDKFNNMGGYEYESRIRGMLKGFGFNKIDYDKNINILSGGQKTRIALAKLLLTQPDLLLLDEPTNFLDIDTIQWLEGYLKNYPGAIMVISHDRYFLNTIVNKIFEIENGQLKQYNGDYSNYVIQKEELYEVSLHQYNIQQKEIQRQREIIQQFRQFNREKSIRKAESREKALDKIELIDKPSLPQKKIHLVLEPQIKSGKIVLEAFDLTKSFGENHLFSGVSFTILRGQKIGIMGQNGTGKSTLLKIIMGQLLPEGGNIQLGHNVFIEFFRQEQEDLKKDNTILQEVWEAKALAPEGEIRNVLAMFNFTGEEVHRSIDTLSGGEASRVILAKLMLSKSNFLLMDEPTNHLDMDTKEVLERAIKHYLGTALIVSHDRYFLNSVVDILFILENGGITIYQGNYKYYLGKIKEQKLLDEINNQPITITKTQQNQIKKKQYNHKKMLKELKNEISQLENKIHMTENIIKDIEREMCSEDFYKDFDNATEKTELYEKSKKELNDLMEVWTKKQIELEEIVDQ